MWFSCDIWLIPCEKCIASHCIWLGEKTLAYQSVQFHSNTYIHTTDGALGGVFQAEGSQGPPGDKLEKNDEHSIKEKEWLLNAQTHTHIQILPAGLLLILLHTF